MRQLPGATVLGLVAALVTHAVLFGREHAWGGAYHSALLQLTLAAAAGFLAAAGALLWSGARWAADGTVLSARIRLLLPKWSAIAVAGAAWYTIGERLEAAHAGVPLVGIVAILVVTAWLIRRFVSVGLRVLATIVFAIVRGVRCARRLPFSFARPVAPRYAQDDRAWYRRFTRPPPIEFASTRA